MTTRIGINLGALVVHIESDHRYPDILDDMTNRARTLLRNALEEATAHGVDVMRMAIAEFEEEDSEE